jgi:hypothetical protein
MLTIDHTKTRALSAMQTGLRDAVYLFVKNEPHAEEKLKHNRLRLIMSISLVDNLVERVLFHRQNKLEIAMCDDITFKPGMGLHDAGMQSLYSWFLEREAEYPLCSTDVSAWDWSIPGWLLDMAGDYRLSLATDQGAFAKLVRCHYHTLSYKTFQTPDGKLYAQTLPGIQASGSYNTSSDNSHMRHMLATLAQLRSGLTPTSAVEGAQMGDDAIERDVPGLKESYESFGFRVKGIETQLPGHFSFCSTAFEGNWMGKPENWGKTLFRFLFKSPADAMYDTYRAQFEGDLRHSPELDGLKPRLDEFSKLIGA